jgi:hypothetical protein
VDPHTARLGGTVIDQPHDGGIVNRRFRVRHAAYPCEPARRRRARSRGDRFLVLLTRLPQVDVHVDEPRADDVVRGFDDMVVAGGKAAGYFGDAAVLQENIQLCIQVLRRIDYTTPSD